MMLLSLDKRIRVPDSRTYVVTGDTILSLDLVEAHAPNQAPKDDRDRHSCTANYRLTMANFGINNDPVFLVHSGLIIPPQVIYPFFPESS
jgi:hypothetical protein